MNSRPVLSLVTGTMDRRESFARLVHSVESYTKVSWELLVSDASQVPYPDTYSERVIVMQERPRLGFTRAYNRTCQAATGKWVIWLNDDAEVLPEYDVNAIDFMERNPQIGLGCLQYSDPTHQGFRTSELWKMPYANFGILSRELGNQIGWFDEDLAMYGSDNSITFRVLMAGKGVGVVPGNAIQHHRVDDQTRKKNNLRATRMADSSMLSKKYFHHRSTMIATYQSALAQVRA